MTEPPLLSVSGLTKSFEVSPLWLDRVLGRRPRQWLRAVDDVSFDVQRGRTLALVGESGCGKTTVARLLVGLHRADAGQIRFDGLPLAPASSTGPDRTLRRRMQMVFQDPMASLNPRWRVRDLVGEPLRELALAVTEAARLQRVAQLLEQVGLQRDDAARYPHQFSGGQRQRISIARALATAPDFLVCDEPTSALDVSVQAQVLNLLKRLQIERGLAMLFISHNLAVVRHIADEVGVMYLGRIVERAPVDELFDRPRHPYTQMLLAAVPRLQPRPPPHEAQPGSDPPTRRPAALDVPDAMTPPTGCAFHPRCPWAKPRCTQERPASTSYGEVMVACHAVAEGRVGVTQVSVAGSAS